MKIITDEVRIAKGARLGKIATFVGLGFLVAGLIISLALQETPLLWLSFGCLLAGLVISSMGTMNMNRWVREPRADQALAQGLKGFDDRYRLYNYTLPAPHVLLSPMGLYVLTAMGQDGVIRYEDDKFQVKVPQPDPDPDLDLTVGGFAVMDTWSNGTNQSDWFDWSWNTVYPTIDGDGVEWWPFICFRGSSWVARYDWMVYDAVTLEVVPEPAALGLLALGGLVLIRRRR